MFRFLHNAANRVVFISDIPTLPESAPLCLSEHRSDVRACTPSRAAATALATVKADELQLANRERVSSIDPTSWFCTPARCPVIVSHLLVYQDNSHMTRQWAQFIAPVLAGAILPIMRSQSRPRAAFRGFRPPVAAHRTALLPEDPTPVSRIDIGERLRKRPLVSPWILGAVLALAEDVIGRLLQDLRSMGPGTLAVLPRVLDADQHRVRDLARPRWGAVVANIADDHRAAVADRHL